MLKILDELIEYSALPVFGLAYTCINRSGVNFILSFIFSLFYFLTNCTKFPFFPTIRFGALHLCYSMPPLLFDPCRLLCSGLPLWFNCAASASIQASEIATLLSALTRADSAAASLYDSILAASSDLDRLSASLLAASARSN